MNKKYSFQLLKQRTKQLNPRDLVEHYRIDYCDGPLSGIIRWDDQRYYAHCVDELYVVEPDPDCEVCDGTGQEYHSRPWAAPYDCRECMVEERVFGLFKLPQDQMDKQDYWHNLFLDFVLNSKKEDRSKEIKDFLFKFYYTRRKKDYEPIDTDYLEPVGFFVREWARAEKGYTISSWCFR